MGTAKTLHNSLLSSAQKRASQGRNRFLRSCEADFRKSRDRRTQRFKLVMRIDRVHFGAGVAGKLLPDFL